MIIGHANPILRPNPNSRHVVLALFANPKHVRFLSVNFVNDRIDGMVTKIRDTDPVGKTDRVNKMNFIGTVAIHQSELGWVYFDHDFWSGAYFANCRSHRL